MSIGRDLEQSPRLDDPDAVEDNNQEDPNEEAGKEADAAISSSSLQNRDVSGNKYLVLDGRCRVVYDHFLSCRCLHWRTSV